MSERATVFAMELVDEIIVISPLGDESSYRYFDIHNQANHVMRRLDDPSVRGVVIDLTEVPTLGWVMTSAIVRLVRNVDYRDGLAVYCAASPSNLNQFSAMKLGRPWTHHETREESIEAMRDLLTVGDESAAEDG